MTFDSETIILASRNMMVTGFTVALAANLRRRNWAYSIALVLAIIESIKHRRFEFHNWMRIEVLGVHDKPGEKIVLQSELIYVTGMLFCALLVLLIPYLVRANAGRRLMVLGTLMAMGILSLELISPHDIDRIIYYAVGPFALYAVGYFISGMLMAWGAILDRRP